MKRVLFVTSEAVPFIKTGGLADVAGSLPKYFSKNEYEVSVMLPKYMCIREDMRKKMHHILHFYVDLGWRKQYVGILEAKEDGTSIILLIMNSILRETDHIIIFTKM